MVTRNLFAYGSPVLSATFCLAVMFVCEKLSWPASSRSEPVTVTSTVVPALPPGGEIVDKRAAGSWAKESCVPHSSAENNGQWRAMFKLTDGITAFVSD